MAPSFAEGWPLPPAETMMSGAALVATDIGVHREHCLDGVDFPMRTKQRCIPWVGTRS